MPRVLQQCVGCCCTDAGGKQKLLASGVGGGHCGRILPAPRLGRILLGNTCVPLAFSCGMELPGTRLWLRVSLPLLLVRLFR